MTARFVDRLLSGDDTAGMSTPAQPRDRLTLFLWGNLAIVAATAVVLRFNGRLWWCACGEPFPWIGDPQSSHCSQHLLDPYAFTHMLHGVGFCGILAIVLPRLSSKWSFTLTTIAECLWELLENSRFVIDRYRMETAALGYVGDSVGNSLGDIAACAAGWWLARTLGWKWSIAVWVVTEVILLFWIRDNLLLNIVMLIWPLEPLKQWQLGH